MKKSAIANLSGSSYSFVVKSKRSGDSAKVSTKRSFADAKQKLSAELSENHLLFWLSAFIASFYKVFFILVTKILL